MDNSMAESMDNAGVIKFRKKPVEVKAIRLTWKNWTALCDFVDFIGPKNPGVFASKDEVTDTCGEDGPSYIKVKIPTLEGNVWAKHGDWIIQGVNGEFYPCNPIIFEKTYELSGE